MDRIVVPICNASDAAWAAAQAIALYRAAPAHVDLLTVQRPLPKHVAQFFSKTDLRDFHRDSGMRVLEPAIRTLDEAGVPHEDHVLVGHPAETIVRFASDHHCAQIVVDEPAKGMLSTNMRMVSAAVCQPLAARPLNNDCCAASSLR